VRFGCVHVRIRKLTQETLWCLNCDDFLMTGSIGPSKALVATVAHSWSIAIEAHSLSQVEAAHRNYNNKYIYNIYIIQYQSIIYIYTYVYTYNHIHIYIYYTQLYEWTHSQQFIIRFPFIRPATGDEKIQEPCTLWQLDRDTFNHIAGMLSKSLRIGCLAIFSYFYMAP
jgi:hypothetical protein